MIDLYLFIDLVPFFPEEEDDYNRYPVLTDFAYSPYDNLQLQQGYNNDDFPIDMEEDLFSV